MAVESLTIPQYLPATEEMSKSIFMDGKIYTMNVYKNVEGSIGFARTEIVDGNGVPQYTMQISFNNV